MGVRLVSLSLWLTSFISLTFLASLYQGRSWAPSVVLHLSYDDALARMDVLMAGFPPRLLLQVGRYPGSDRSSSFRRIDYENYVVWMLPFIYGFYGDVVSARPCTPSWHC